MSAYQGSEDPSQVTWNSSANGWCGGCAPMEDFDGDGIYSITVPLEGDSIEYKFGIGNWADEENLIPESSCTRTTYDEGAPNGCCYVNRVVSAAGEEPFDVPVVCWNECSSCTDSVSTSVTFRVDMSNEDVSAFGVHVAGDFQGWDPATTEMTDPDGDMIYEYVHTFAPRWLRLNTNSSTATPGQMLSKLWKVNAPTWAAIVHSTWATNPTSCCLPMATGPHTASTNVWPVSRPCW